MKEGAGWKGSRAELSSYGGEIISSKGEVGQADNALTLNNVIAQIDGTVFLLILSLYVS